MVICQTPFRVSFFGGGTDYKPWYLEHGGAVLSTTINKYGYITCRHLPPFFEFKHRIVYSKIELVNEIHEINHPAVRAVFEYLNVQEGLEIHYDGDIPARSGIGSSSSFTVGLLNAIHTLRGNSVSRQVLAEQALHIEQDLLKESVGSQDQIAAAFGGFNRIDFLPDNTFAVRPFEMPKPRRILLQDSILLFFTGFSRIADSIAKSKVENFKKKQDHLHRMFQMVNEGEQLLMSSNDLVKDFGQLLDEGWLLKRDLSEKVSSSEIDEIYQAGIAAGAYGGKLLGAGGGGFILFVVPQEKHNQVRMALRNLLEVPIEFDTTGSTIITNNPVRLISPAKNRRWG